MANETYTAAVVRESAIEMDERTKLAELALQKGETAWNPLSTKGPIYGPVIVKYVIQPSGINVGLYPLGRCVGMNRLTYGDGRLDEWVQCPHKIDPMLVRCEDHELSETRDPEKSGRA